MRKLAPLFCILSLLCVSHAVEAQSPVIIDRVAVTFTGPAIDPVGSFTFKGPAFVTLTGTLIDGVFSPSCLPCEGGQQIRISSVYSGEQSIRPGTLTNGIETRPVYYAGNLVFDSGPITLPTRYGRAPFRVTVPIALQGHIQVHGTNPFTDPGNLLFEFPMSLQGTATLTLRTDSINLTTGRPSYKYLGVTYEFPVPEVTQDK